MIVDRKQRQIPKHQQIYDALVKTLTSDRFKIGDKLPSERDFAAELNVNVLTVRRAFRELIAGGIVDKRIGSGTYLIRNITSNWTEHDVNIVIDTKSTSAIQKTLENLGQVVAERHHRRCRLVYSNTENIREIIHSSVTYQQPTILFGLYASEFRDIQKEILQAPELFVVFSEMLYENGIPSVMGDDTHGFNLLMTHLQKLGHRKIAFLSGQSLAVSRLIRLQTSLWSSALGSYYHPSLKIELPANAYDQIQGAHQVISQALKHISFSALICATDELMFGAAAALRENGKNIPDDVSIVSIGNTSLSRYNNPPVTCTDPNLEAHLDAAFQMLFHNLNHPERLETLRLIKPILITRESTNKKRSES